MPRPCDLCKVIATIFGGAGDLEIHGPFPLGKFSCLKWSVCRFSNSAIRDPETNSKFAPETLKLVPMSFSFGKAARCELLVSGRGYLITVRVCWMLISFLLFFEFFWYVQVLLIKCFYAKKMQKGSQTDVFYRVSPRKIDPTSERGEAASSLTVDSKALSHRLHDPNGAIRLLLLEPQFSHPKCHEENSRGGTRDFWKDFEGAKSPKKHEYSTNWKLMWTWRVRIKWYPVLKTCNAVCALLVEQSRGCNEGSPSNERHLSETLTLRQTSNTSGEDSKSVKKQPSQCSCCHCQQKVCVNYVMFVQEDQGKLAIRYEGFHLHYGP